MGGRLRQLADGDTLATRLTRGLFSATIILLVAELIWQIAKTVIEYPYRSSAVSGMCDRRGSAESGTLSRTSLGVPGSTPPAPRPERPKGLKKCGTGLTFRRRDGSAGEAHLLPSSVLPALPLFSSPSAGPGLAERKGMFVDSSNRPRLAMLACPPSAAQDMTGSIRGRTASLRIDPSAAGSRQTPPRPLPLPSQAAP